MASHVQLQTSSLLGISSISQFLGRLKLIFIFPSEAIVLPSRQTCKPPPSPNASVLHIIPPPIMYLASDLISILSISHLKRNHTREYQVKDDPPISCLSLPNNLRSRHTLSPLQFHSFFFIRISAAIPKPFRISVTGDMEIH